MASIMTWLINRHRAAKKRRLEREDFANDEKLRKSIRKSDRRLSQIRLERGEILRELESAKLEKKLDEIERAAREKNEEVPSADGDEPVAILVGDTIIPIEQPLDPAEERKRELREKRERLEEERLLLREAKINERAQRQAEFFERRAKQEAAMQKKEREREFARQEKELQRTTEQVKDLAELLVVEGKREVGRMRKRKDWSEKDEAFYQDQKKKYK